MIKKSLIILFLLGIIVGYFTYLSYKEIAKYNEAGALVVFYDEDKKDITLKAVEELGLKIDYISTFNHAIICRWEGELSGRTLNKLKKISNIEVAHPLVLH